MYVKMEKKVLETKDIDLNNPNYYNNRELSWLAFNERVLQEAMDENTPLLERLKFLAIFSSNLDEFFMVRVAGLKDQVMAGFNKPENKAGLTPKQQLSKISKYNHHIVKMQYDVFNHKLLPKLKNENIRILSIEDVTELQFRYLEKLFDENIFPVLTPMAVDAYHPFPMLLSKSINLAILLNDRESQDLKSKNLAIVQVPAVIDRFIKLPGQREIEQYILLEDVISHFIWKLFSGFEVVSVTQFRITRNADLTIHEEGARDLLKEIEKELKKRKAGAAVRLEVTERNMDYSVLKFLLNVLEIHEKDVYQINGPLDLTFLFSFISKVSVDKEHLVFETLFPQTPKDLSIDENIFETISRKDVLLHHPYESFEPIVDFLEDAAIDPYVLAIKQTLYRVSGDSPVIEALKTAAENGKQVTVLVELKARFDEENNVQWAKMLEKSGCHVIYGMNYLKTHSKITLVVRQEEGEIQRFVHLGTGNYNDATAKLYTDMGLLTSHNEFGEDATNFFNFLSGYSEKPTFNHIRIAPFDIRDEFVSLIEREIQLHRKKGSGRIIAKMNSLTDKVIIKKLYEASRAGVKIDLITRGICCLRPELKEVSENIRVISIVGRFLEHTRIYYFHHNGEEKTYLSSADLMTRNMAKRVEILFPIYDRTLKRRIKIILDTMLNDNVKARKQDHLGQYHYVKRLPREAENNSQLALYDMAYQVEEDEE
jgi:polyphosphate kinase